MFRSQPINTSQESYLFIDPVRTLVLVCAVSTILGALLIISADGLGLVSGLSGQGFSNTLIEKAMGILFLAGKVLILVGLVGLYLRQAHAAGRFGVAAFLVALAGTGLMIASDWSEVFIAPVLAEAVPDIGTNVPPRIMVGFILNFAIDTLGQLMFGIATFRARVLPRAAALLLIAGIFIPFSNIPWGYIFLYTGFAWLGIAVLHSMVQAPLPVLDPTGGETVEQV